MKKFIKFVNKHAYLCRDDRSGVAWIVDRSTGLQHSIHPNIDGTGSITGMKNLGFWGKTDKIVRANGCIFNISHLVSDEINLYNNVLTNECMCECCINRR